MNSHLAETWCVCGGGVLGMVLALRLSQAGKRVTICEAAPETGGLAAVWTIDEITWDKHYHVILPADSRLLSLLDEIGLSEELEWKRSRTGFFANGRLSPLDGAIDYLRLPSLGLVAKARIAFTLMMAARIRDGRPLESIPIKQWLIKWSGRQAFDRLWSPLLRAKLGDNAEVASASFIWATIRRLYLARSAGVKTESLGFVSGGYQRILRILKAHLEAQGVEILTSCAIKRVTQEHDHFRVETSRGDRTFDKVVSTLPCGPTARLCEEISPDVKTRLDSVVYQGIICASLVLDRPLAGYYLTYLTDPNLPFTAVVEMSALTGTQKFGGKTLVYLPRYVTQDDEFWKFDDDELQSRFVAGLSSIYPEFDVQSLSAFRVSRVRNVMAVPSIGYADVVPPVLTNVNGFYIMNSAQITNGTLNVDATLGVIENALPKLLASSHADKTKSAA